MLDLDFRGEFALYDEIVSGNLEKGVSLCFTRTFTSFLHQKPSRDSDISQWPLMILLRLFIGPLIAQNVSHSL